MRRYLVTGAGGFLGSHVIKSLLASGQQVVAMDLLPPKGNTRLLPVLGQVEYKWQSVVDLTSRDLKDWGVQYILHFAALTDVPLANSSPRYTFQLNVDAALSLFLAAKDSGVPVLAMSTENIIGSIPEERLPATEDEPPRPKNPYAASKVAVEALGRAYSFQHRFPVSIIRSSTLFGPEMRMGQVVAIFCRQAINDEPITMEGDGNQSRDFNYVDNMVDAITRVIDWNRANRVRHDPVGLLQTGFNLWHIGSGTEWSLKQLVDKIIELTGSKSEIVYKPWRPGEEGRLSISIEKARKELGYEPKVSVEDGLRRLIAWMKAQPNFVQPSRSAPAA